MEFINFFPSFFFFTFSHPIYPHIIVEDSKQGGRKRERERVRETNKTGKEDRSRSCIQRWSQEKN